MSKPSIDEVLSCPTLPSLPAVAMDVLELTRDSDVQLSQIAQTVQNDPALAAKILRTVNSSFYALSQPCPTIARALAYLGLTTVKSLVLGFSLVDITRRKGGGFDLTEYWRRCLCSAVAARALAGRSGQCDPEEAFTAGLMQDIGMLAIQATDPAYGEVVAEAEGDHARLPAVERNVYQFEHAEAGARLAEQWRLPPEIVEAIQCHHHPAPNGPPDLVGCVGMGLEVGEIVWRATPETIEATAEQLASDRLHWVGESVKTLLETIASDARELGRLFNVDTGASTDVKRLLAEAEEASMMHQLAVQREAEDLRKSNDELARQATTDALTGIANRKVFDTELQRHFDQTRNVSGSLGLLMADVDRFKAINDTRGHQVGDEVLIELGNRLTDVLRKVDLVCRYGGEEFASILPGASIRDVAAIAERLRLAVAERPFAIVDGKGDREELEVTISVGAAVLDAGSLAVISTPQILVMVADKALYAAKEAGRNCVRVFRPGAAKAA